MKMMVINTLLLVPLLFSPAFGCSTANWGSSFDKAGYSTCPTLNEYMNGLYRNDNQGENDGIHLIEQARCCGRTSPYRNQPTQCLAADWLLTFDVNNRWGTCPTGFFLRGLYRSGEKNLLNNIEYGKCCKPANHPYWWGECYDENVQTSFDNKGTSKCKEGYFMTGLYKGGCAKLYCLEKFKCCKMYPSPPALESLSDVKTRVMDVTMYDLANLANYLGYGWCAGCRAQYVGEDFRRNGDSWEADKKGPCNGYKANQRLKMHYGDFKFSMKNIKFGDAVIQSLQPAVYLTGRVTNDDQNPLTHKLDREVSSVRTVTHTTTSSWKVAHELGIEISYTPPGATGGVGGKVNYKFNYESSQTTTDSESNQQTKKITVRSEKTLQKYSAASYRIMLTKTRSTVPYTATVIAQFSAELDGFLRWGGGYNGESTNYHYQHRGSDDRPTLKYRFGNAKTPFYKALKEQSDRSVRPWLWSDMKNRYNSNAQNLINNLVDEGRYEFTLTGQFEDVVGQHADVQWKTEPLNGRKRSAIFKKKPAVFQEDFPESPISDDPPRVFPRPPVVSIDTGKYTGERQKVKILGN